MCVEEVAYYGLVCGICNPSGCNCKTVNHCGKRLPSNGCYQYKCCTNKGNKGCWACELAPCGIDMLSPENIKVRAFIRV